VAWQEASSSSTSKSTQSPKTTRHSVPRSLRLDEGFVVRSSRTPSLDSTSRPTPVATMGFFCCSSSDRPSKADAETRHARLVTDARTPYPRPLPQQWDFPYQDSPPAYHDIAQQPLRSIDEKQALHFHMSVQDAEASAPPSSPRSSVISIPSTRLTGLTAAQTGESALTSRRQSLEQVSTRGSLPPYSGHAVRTPSPASLANVDGSERDEVWTHPVMSDNWLQNLRQTSTLREGAGRAGAGVLLNRGAQRDYTVRRTG
jgi:hypothetical protein